MPALSQASPPRRRTVLQALAAMLALPIAGTALLLGRARATRRPRSVSVPYPGRDGVSFFDEVILVREAGQVIALSARCPHLGCRIGQQAESELVCPCHGSRFTLVGGRLRGPAARDLERLNLKRRVDANGAEMADVELDP